MKLPLAAAVAAIATAAVAQGGPPGPPPGRDGIEARVAERFAMIDADHDGVVTRAELDAFLAKRRVAWETAHKAHRDQAFDRLDKDRDGKLSRSEFDSPPPPGGPEGPGRHRHGGGPIGPHWFDLADADHDGRVTLAEAKAAALTRFDRRGHDGPPPAAPRGPGYDLPAAPPAPPST